MKKLNINMVCLYLAYFGAITAAIIVSQTAWPLLIMILAYPSYSSESKQ